MARTDIAEVLDMMNDDNVIMDGYVREALNNMVSEIMELRHFKSRIHLMVIE